MSYGYRISAKALLLAICTIAACVGVSFADEDGSAKTVHLDQICELYMDFPMSADELYHDKTVKTTVTVSSVRKIPLICAGSPEGSFTMEITTKEGPLLECYCSPPTYISVLENTPPGSSLAVTGTFKSMTGSYTQSDEQKQCKVTMHSCSFK
jgi:hypothetical protein